MRPSFVLSVTLAAVATISPVSLLASPTAQARAAAVDRAPEQVDPVVTLFNAISAVSVFRPAAGNRDLIEANVVYTVDQSGQPCPVTVAALRMAMGQAGLAQASQSALKTVFDKVAQCDPTSIAAIGGGAGAQLAAGPAIGVGGGNSNYDAR